MFILIHIILVDMLFLLQPGIKSMNLKKITCLFIILSLMASCVKAPLEEIVGDDTYCRTISLQFNDSHDTKAIVSGLDNVTLFVYCSIDGDNEFLYKRVYADDGSELVVDFIFSDQREMRYYIKAYGNFGELTSEPSRVALSQELPDYLTCHGESGISSSSANSISIQMQPYAWKVSLSGINVDLSSSFTSSLSLVGIVASGFSTSVNTMTNEPSTLIFIPDAISTGSESQSTSISLPLNCMTSVDFEWYGYGSSILLRVYCMYNEKQYSYDIRLDDLSAGKHRDVVLDIKLLGKSEPVINAGAGILHVNGQIYSASDWSYSSSDAVGVVVSDGDHAFVIHPDREELLVWSDIPYDIGVGFVKDRNEMIQDMDGIGHTQAILDALDFGYISSAPAAVFCSETIFANGESGYLPSSGEIYMMANYISGVNSCLSKIGGKKFGSKSSYSTSTQVSYSHMWIFMASASLTADAEEEVSDTDYSVRFDYGQKYEYTYWVRPVSRFFSF